MHSQMIKDLNRSPLVSYPQVFPGRHYLQLKDHFAILRNSWKFEIFNFSSKREEDAKFILTDNGIQKNSFYWKERIDKEQEQRIEQAQLYILSNLLLLGAPWLNNTTGTTRFNRYLPEWVSKRRHSKPRPASRPPRWPKLCPLSRWSRDEIHSSRDRDK